MGEVKDRSVPLIATVECQSQARGDDLPVAIVFGGERFEIVNTLDRAMVTGVEAGGPITHRLWVVTEDQRRLKLTRVLPDGKWRVTTFNV